MSAYGLIKDPEIFVEDHVSIFRFFVNNGGLTNLGTWTLSAALHQTVGGATFAAQTGGRRSLQLQR